MRNRTIIILLLFPLLFLWALGCKLTSTSEERPAQKRQTKNASGLATHIVEEPPAITET